MIEKDQAVPQLLPDHMTAQTMRDLVGRTAWANLYSFAIVRNPWDRVFSLFNYLRKENDIPEEWSFSEFVEHMVTADENSAYLSFHALRFGSADFVTDETGSLIVTKIVRFENRQSELREVAQRLQLPELGTAHLQSASPTGADFRSAYDAKTRDLVGERFKLDIELFNYEF
ncbi:MAG: hypothetical protein GJ676_03265 [Rhodobacteraceae bacterium]|nr:hypothetical protein [Paracoccaceae bacterium]